MNILVLQFEEHEGHFFFTPSLRESGEVVINLPPEANRFITIVRNGDVTQIFATNTPATEGWLD